MTIDRDNSPQGVPASLPPLPTVSDQIGSSITEPPAPDLPPARPADPAWNGWDVVRIVLLGFVAWIACTLAAIAVTKWWIFPHLGLSKIVVMPLVAIAGQAAMYLIVLGYMFVLVTRERRQPDFLAAIHWNFPSKFSVFLVAGIVLSVALQALAHFLPIPKNLPMDQLFRSPMDAWVLGIFSVTLAPLMEELFFRAFLYPVLARRLGAAVSVILTALGFALLHGWQLLFSWGPVLVIFIVGLVLTIVRATRNSVASSLLIHIAYNGTISVLMFIATDGFRHLEKLNNQ